ncbi:RagB/SusD family nutrient uptake outer membrane protein [Pseudopedobacter beijingensis]|uniref:RagB/SusD family nutrient uptake outer membrane protein n=1 Tax=Pseudopedobacter beijingensis TaxID=1207056 RepID=A0ABW4IC71_9SPHI
MKFLKIYFVAVSLMFASCNDFLDEQPISEIPAGEMWKTSRDAQAGVSEIYGLLRNALRENYWAWGEFRSDNFEKGAPTAVDQEMLMANLLTSTHRNASWTSLYRVINQTNLAIKYLPQVNMPSAADKNDLLGQAYALRALSYLYAVKVWGNVPLLTSPIENLKEGVYSRQVSANRVLQEVIIPDLKKAETLINRTKNKERKKISIYGVWAIMADAYTWQHEYSLADQTIDKMSHEPTFMRLETDIASLKRMFVEELKNKAPDFTPENDDYTSKELIFVLHYDMKEVGANGYSFMYQWFTGSGNRVAVLSNALLSKFETGDLRKDIYAQNYQGGWELNKFIGGTISTTLNKTCEVAYPVYRYTDILLLQAEAKANLGKWEEALDIVKKVRDRAGIGATTRSAASFANQDEVIDYILKERQVELVGEGKRWFDLVRTNTWKKTMEPINGMNDPRKVVFPVYYSHLIENPELEPNPGY